MPLDTLSRNSSGNRALIWKLVNFFVFAIETVMFSFCLHHSGMRWMYEARIRYKSDTKLNGWRKQVDSVQCSHIRTRNCRGYLVFDFDFCLVNRRSLRMYQFTLRGCTPITFGSYVAFDCVSVWMGSNAHRECSAASVLFIYLFVVFSVPEKKNTQTKCWLRRESVETALVTHVTHTHSRRRKRATHVKIICSSEICRKHTVRWLMCKRCLRCVVRVCLCGDMLVRMFVFLFYLLDLLFRFCRSLAHFRVICQISLACEQQSAAVNRNSRNRTTYKCKNYVEAPSAPCALRAELSQKKTTNWNEWRKTKIEWRRFNRCGGAARISLELCQSCVRRWWRRRQLHFVFCFVLSILLRAAMCLCVC